MSILLQKQPNILVLLIPRSSDKSLGGLLVTRALTVILGWLLAWLPVEYPSACRSSNYSKRRKHRSRVLLALDTCPAQDLSQKSFLLRSSSFEYEGKTRIALQGYFAWANICKPHECVWLYTAGNHILPHQHCSVFTMEGEAFNPFIIPPSLPSWYIFLYFSHSFLQERREMNV